MNELMKLVREFLEGARTFEEFEGAYYELWLAQTEDVPSEEYDFFQQVHERLDWTTQVPTQLERKDGWWDREEYEAWLRDKWATRQL